MFFVSTILALLVLDGKKPAVSSIDIRSLPSRIGSWDTIENIKFQNRVIDTLGTDDVIGRIYRDPAGRCVELIIVKAVNNRAAFHPPEYCMIGSGSEILQHNVRSIHMPEIKSGRIEVNEMIFSADKGRGVLVHNIYASGKDFFRNFYIQQLRIVFDRMRNGFSKGMAINVYSEIKMNDVESARNASEDFLKSLVPLLSEYSE